MTEAEKREERRHGILVFIMINLMILGFALVGVAIRGTIGYWWLYP